MITVQSVEYKNKKFLVTFDNEIFFMLYKGELKKYNIEEGTALVQDKFDELINIIYKRARERALYLLDDAYKTRKQIEDKLKSGRYPQFIIDKVIAYLEEYNMVNDLRYAKLYIDFKKNSKSKKEIISGLYQKGVSRDDIDMAFEETEYSEDDSLNNLISKKRNRYDLSDKKQLQSFYRYLCSKGYSYQKVMDALREYEL